MNTTASVRPRNRGFTLVELMMVLTVLGVMMAFAVPNFKEYRRNAALTDTANTFVSSVYRTRTEAMKDGVPVILKPCNDGCTSTGTDWQKGWVIFADRDGNDAYSEGDEIISVQQGDEIPDYIAISVNRDGFVKFKGTGFPGGAGTSGAGNLTITVNRTDKPDNNRYVRYVTLSASGRVRTCRPDRDTTGCP